MENLSHPLILFFLITWAIEFYLFGMQRASLKISRHNNVEWRGIGEQLLPQWYPLVTWIFRISKYGILVAILFTIGWKWAVSLLIANLILASIIPIPYKLFYRKIFRTRIKKLHNIDKEAGEMFETMLNNYDF